MEIGATKMHTRRDSCQDGRMATPLHDFRVEDDLWARALARAKTDSSTVTKVIKARLALYGRTFTDDTPTASVTDLLTNVIASGPEPASDADHYLAQEAAADLLRAIGTNPLCDSDHTAPTAGGSKRNARIDDDLWTPAEQRADAGGTTMSQVIRDRLALYGTQVPQGAPERDPWEIINLLVRKYGVGPDTDLGLAREAAADLLRALGIRPVRGDQEVKER